MERVEPVDVGPRYVVARQQQARQADLVLLHNQLLAALLHHARQQLAEHRVRRGSAAEGEEIGPDVEVVGIVGRVARHPFTDDFIERDALLEAVARHVPRRCHALGRLQSPPVARGCIHLREHMVERSHQVATVVHQQQLVVAIDHVPADVLRGKPRPRAEVVGAVTLRPCPLHERRKAVHLIRRHPAVGQVVHVRVSRQFAHVTHHVVVHAPVRVVAGKQADPTGRRRRQLRSRGEHGLRPRIQPQRIANHQVVDQGVDPLVGGIEMAGPVPPYVELARRIAQFPPSVTAEMRDRIETAGSDIAIVGQVVLGVEHAGGGDQGHVELGWNRSGFARRRDLGRQGPARLRGMPHTVWSATGYTAQLEVVFDWPARPGGSLGDLRAVPVRIEGTAGAEVLPDRRQLDDSGRAHPAAGGPPGRPLPGLGLTGCVANRPSARPVCRKCTSGLRPLSRTSG